jgi:hypothetical protein
LHELPYVTDYTNFQPDLTLRNAIRHVLVNNEKKRLSTQPAVVRLLPLCTFGVEILIWLSMVGATPSSSHLGGQGGSHEDRLGELEHSDFN